MDNLNEANTMIKLQKYFLTKDRKIGFEIKTWEDGHITIIYEGKSKSNILRRYRTFTKKECIHMPEWLFLYIIIGDIKGMKPVATLPLIPKSLLG